MTAQSSTVRASASQKLAASAALTIMASTGGPLTAATVSKDGSFSYNVSSVPFLAEAAKLLLSVVMLAFDTAGSSESEEDAMPLHGRNARDHAEKSSSCCTGTCEMQSPFSSFQKQLREVLRQVTGTSMLIYFPPSLLFIIMNNLRIWNMRYIDPASAELLNTLRIALTAVMLRCFLRRSFTNAQWASVVLLSLSVALGQMDGTRFVIVGDLRGVLGMTIVSSCSALASVYMEWALKGNLATSMHVQNSQMYVWGVLLNGATFLLTGTKSDAFSPRSLIHGYTPLTWLLVLHLACSGLIVSWILKYSDSITKIQATSASLFLTAVISAAWLGTHVSANLMAGIALSSASLFMYHGLLLAPFSSKKKRGDQEEETETPKHRA